MSGCFFLKHGVHVLLSNVFLFFPYKNFAPDSALPTHRWKSHLKLQQKCNNRHFSERRTNFIKQ